MAVGHGQAVAKGVTAAVAAIMSSSAAKPPVHLQRGYQSQRIERSIIGGALLAAQQIDRHLPIVQSLGVQGYARAIAGARPPIAVEDEIRHVTSPIGARAQCGRGTRQSRSA